MTGPRRGIADRGPRPAGGEGANRVRIVGGIHRGRKIAFPDAAGLRPTGDRVRETLFNWLAPVLPGCRCLDLFAGSGVLGIEAASRGAGEVVLVESAPRVATALRETIGALRLNEQVRLVEADALRWLGSAAPVPFDVVFLDPPFAAGLLAEAAAALERGGWLAEGALVYLERAQAPGPWPVPAHWEIVREKHAGQVSYALARRGSARGGPPTENRGIAPEGAPTTRSEQSTSSTQSASLALPGRSGFSPTSRIRR